MSTQHGFAATRLTSRPRMAKHKRIKLASRLMVYWMVTVANPTEPAGAGNETVLRCETSLNDTAIPLVTDVERVPVRTSMLTC